MRELALLTFMTLDGVMQSPKMPEEDRSGGFEGGWVEPYWDEVMAMVGRQAMAKPYDVLLGRRTHDLVAANARDNLLSRFKKYVATSSPDTLGWSNSEAVTGVVAAGVAALKRRDGLLLQVHGSCRLIQTLLARDLVDELTDSGPPLFPAVQWHAS